MQARPMPSCGICLSVCVSVCLSATFVNHVKRNKDIFEFFSPSGSHTILVFHTKRGGDIPTGIPPNGGVEYRWGRQKSRFWAYIWLQCLLLTLQPTKRALALYTITVDLESCVWQQGSTLRRRQQNRIELYALVNLKPK